MEKIALFILICFICACQDDQVEIGPYTCHTQYFENTSWDASRSVTTTYESGEMSTITSSSVYEFKTDNELIVSRDNENSVEGFWLVQCSPDVLQISTPFGIDSNGMAIFYNTFQYNIEQINEGLKLSTSYYKENDFHEISLTLTH